MSTRVFTATNPNNDSIRVMAHESLRYYHTTEGAEEDRRQLERSVEKFLGDMRGHAYVSVAFLVNDHETVGGVTMGVGTEDGTMRAVCLIGYDAPGRRDDAVICVGHAAMVFAMERFNTD